MSKFGNPEKFECHQCPEAFYDFSALKQHTRNHTAYQLYTNLRAIVFFHEGNL